MFRRIAGFANAPFRAVRPSSVPPFLPAGRVILLRDLTTGKGSTELCILVQAFTVPDDQHPVENGDGEIRLSHVGIHSGDKTVFAVIRNPVVDSITGAISVKLLERPSECPSYYLHRPDTG